MIRSWRLWIVGAPRTKKNHGVLIHGRSQLIPSASYRDWEKKAQIVVLDPVGSQKTVWAFNWKKGSQKRPNPLPKPKTFVPVGIPLNCHATFYRERETGDAVGYYQALADLLEARGILDNDRQIVAWDGTRLRKDPDSPSVVVVLTEMAYALDPPLPDEESGDKEVAFR